MNSNPPSAKGIIFWDLERELAVTRKVLEHLPPEHFAWKPHEKSMSLGKLALHVATLPDWVRRNWRGRPRCRHRPAPAIGREEPKRIARPL